MKHTFLTFSDTAKSQVPSSGKHEMASCPGWSEIPESWPVVTECTREGWGVRSGIFLPPSGCLRSPNPSTSRVPNERHIGTWDNHINKCWIWCGNSCFCTKEILVCKNPWGTSSPINPEGQTHSVLVVNIQTQPVNPSSNGRLLSNRTQGMSNYNRNVWIICTNYIISFILVQ